MAANRRLRLHRRSSRNEHTEAIDSDFCDNMKVGEIHSENSSVSKGIGDCCDESENDSRVESESEESEDSQVPESVTDGTDESESGSTPDVT